MAWVHERIRGEGLRRKQRCFYADESDPAEERMMKQGRGELLKSHPSVREM